MAHAPGLLRLALLVSGILGSSLGSDAAGEWTGQCVKDSWSRLLDHEITITSLTPNECIKECQEANFALAGVEHGDECWCGNTPPPAEVLKPIEDCDMECTGDAGQTCGGTWRMNVYSKVDCKWNTWGSWDSCSKTCGGGTKTRTRTSVKEQHGGKPCEGSTSSSSGCNDGACPVDCKWNTWGSWDSCSKTCGDGTMTRTRTSVKEQHGGKPCEGSTSSSSGCDGSCPANWSCLPTGCYLHQEELRTWAEAKAACEEKKGYLVEVTSQEEQDALAKELVMAMATGNSVWIGLTDAAKEGSWVWEHSGDALSYSSWNFGEPNDAGSEDCVQIKQQWNGNFIGMAYTNGWNDEKCSTKMQSMCEI